MTATSQAGRLLFGAMLPAIAVCRCVLFCCCQLLLVGNPHSLSPCTQNLGATMQRWASKTSLRRAAKEAKADKLKREREENRLYVKMGRARNVTMVKYCGNWTPKHEVILSALSLCHEANPSSASFEPVCGQCVCHTY